MMFCKLSLLHVVWAGHDVGHLFDAEVGQI